MKLLKHSYIILLLFLANLSLNAQQVRTCGTDAKLEELRQSDPNLDYRRQKIEEFTQEWILKHGQDEMKSVINIPVVVHVIYRTSVQNISDAQIQSQISVLNKDYRALNSDTVLIPAEFKSLLADVQFEFCLASQDPSGNWTNGITRTQTSVVTIGQTNNYYLTAQGGHDIWDRNKYLNIWVCELGSSLLGFATPPGAAPASMDGVVIGYEYFGTFGAVSAPFNKGRTSTHEIGHWFNLEHIWGNYGGCSDDDQVSDTPMQSLENYGCPSHPQASCGSNDMFMNYMDYVNDACMNMFTTGQKQRMLAAINGPRSSLLISVGCQAVGIEDVNGLCDKISVFPNPATNSVSVAFQIDSYDHFQIQFVNTIGEVVYSTESSIFNHETISINTNNINGGTYFLRISNGKQTVNKKVVIVK